MSHFEPFGTEHLILARKKRVAAQATGRYVDGIWERGPEQFQARVRRKVAGKLVTLRETFTRHEDALRWKLLQDSRLTGEDFEVEEFSKEARCKTPLREVLLWRMDQIAPRDDNGLRRPRFPDAKNQVAKCRYWLDDWADSPEEREHDFALSTMNKIKSRDLIAWRRFVLDEDNAEDGETVGPDAKCSAQTVIHRLNALAQVYKKWIIEHDLGKLLENPVGERVRPPAPAGRERRLQEGEEERLIVACRKVPEKPKVHRTWLAPAVIISVETGMRQTELATMTWDRVKLQGSEPTAFIPAAFAKNDRGRTVPLSIRAVAAFRELQTADGVIGPVPVFPIETGRGIIHAFNDYVSEDAFPDLRWHDLRHEAISRLFELTDLREIEIMAIVGHLSAEMTRRYTHLRAGRLAARLPGGSLHRPLNEPTPEKPRRRTKSK